MQHPSTTSSAVDQYRELTIRGMILGALITVIFTASNVYLGLKVGLTFASSIPAAVISMAVLKCFQGSNILENNMVQTQASAAGTLSSIIFVLPGLLMIGYWQGFPFWQTTLICVAGGVLGVIFTVPLRHVLVVNSKLPYPEGLAAAEILKAGDHNQPHEGEGDTPQSGVKQIVSGSILSGIFSFLVSGLRVVSESASVWFKAGSAVFQVPMGFSLALLGAGWLVGITGGIAVLLGMFFSWGIAVPYFTSTTPMPENTDMVNFAINLWVTKVRYIGAGAIAVAAIWTLITLFKPMLEGMRLSFQAFSSGSDSSESRERVNQDLSPKTMLLIMMVTLIILVATFYSFIASAPISFGLACALVACATIMAFIIGFLVAAASGYMAGLIGSSSSPISSIGIVSIVIISLVFMVIGQSSGIFAMAGGNQFMTALALFTASVVMAISTISNDNLQDLKTGHLVQATPWRQQVALIIGSVVGAIVISPVLELLYNAYGFTGALPRSGMDASQALSAPQATLMTTIAKGIFSHNLEWTYIMAGVCLGIFLVVLDMVVKRLRPGCSVPPLAVGMGIYLPASVNMPIFIGTVLSYFCMRHVRKRYTDPKTQERELKATDRRGTLLAAGLIVGESIVGVVMAMLIVVSIALGSGEAPLALNLDHWDKIGQVLGLVFFISAIVILVRQIMKK
ncbi:oligopeptide transporter, OPT family [Snodgrassella alvi]|jgi:putative OPT family oligopeptide transporter|uniref:OPT family oligopeptide transporter n=1 Tax=Snodgrassella alvi TaxID=1196083 RepID=UPI000C1E13EA|nr:oligopeptide transporter, OPT family [Snodgrassella alvi]PIT12619.1 oligopeptide transporter, OPT family [Snodgrassella alvi]PIT27345.1 oligopeptide transporter, OPT family [Snodgrassella alvi]PIT55948.1 oligopeptide transporter, OPT family [Snodgrassella alvi]